MRVPGLSSRATIYIFCERKALGALLIIRVLPASRILVRLCKVKPVLESGPSLIVCVYVSESF